jgi:type II secretory pathway pseudopilin PulG
MKKSRSAFTLIEILVACILAVLVLGVVGRVIWMAMSLEEEISSSYLVRQDADVAFRTLQDDLRLTSLSTIRVDSADRGFSCASPLLERDRASFEISEYGVATWKSWVHYTVSPTSKELGDLVRWEAPYPADEREPRPSTLSPWEIGEAKQSLLPGVVQAGIGVITAPPPESYEELGPVTSEKGGGGLRVRFFRRDGSLSTTNPSQASDDTVPGWSDGVTMLVDCQLQVAEKSTQTGRWSIYTLNFRVCPRN